MVDRKLWLLDEKASAAGLAELPPALAAHPRLALDLESDSFHRYVERICLLQVGTPDTDVLYDPITHGLPPELRAQLASPARTWILHGADYDVLSFKREYGLTLGRLFDTHVAARFLGLPGLGLKALLEGQLGVVIEKGEQRSDWRRRPLSQSQLGYARQDVAHLLPLAERLMEQLEARGRLAWAEEECELVRRKEPVAKEPDPDAYLSIKGVRELDPPGLAAAKAAFEWRERTAKRRDVAPFRVVSNEVIAALARKMGPLPSLPRLRAVKGVPSGGALEDLSEAIDRALVAPPPSPSPRSRARPAGPSGAPGTRERVERLKRAREAWAAELGLEAALLLPGSVLEALAARPPASREALFEAPGMTRWRVEAVGDALWNAVASG